LELADPGDALGVEHVEIVAWAEPRSAFGWLSGVAYNRSRELGAVTRGSCALGESSLSSLVEPQAS
jgi:hypothetical protein